MATFLERGGECGVQQGVKSLMRSLKQYTSSASLGGLTSRTYFVKYVLTSGLGAEVADPVAEDSGFKTGGRA